LEDLNERAERFWTSPVQMSPNEEITKRFWQGREYEKLPYDRGLLYAAEVDAAIRAKSKGQRSLDDVMLDLVSRSRAAGAASGSEWGELGATAFREAVGRELGADGEARYDAVIVRGELPSVPADAFGPCFKGSKAKLFKYELGFDLQALLKEKRLPKILAGSAAARAGLKEGEAVPNFSLERGNVHRPVQIVVARNGKNETVEYFARGDAVDGFKWEIVPKLPNSNCAR
jgi:predicted metalloprotease with PDZ domain